MKKIYKNYISSYQGLSPEVWMLSLVMLLNRIGGMVLPFLTVYLITVLDFETDEAGLVMSFFGIGALLGSVAGGWLTDKFGAFYIQFFSLILAAPVFILLHHLTTVTEICLAILLLSFVNESFRPANSAAITNYTKKGNLTRSFSLNRMAINLGFSFGPALGGFLATFSWAWLFYGNSMGSLMAGLVFFWYFFKRKKRNEILPTNSEKAEDIVEHQRVGSPYLDKWFMVFSFFCFLYACVFFQLISVLPIYYEKVIHLNQANIGLLLAFNGVFVFLTEMPIVRFVENRFNIYVSIALGGIFLLLAFAWLLIDHSLFSCYISMMLLSLSELLVLPFISTVAAHRSTLKNKGAYMGLNGLSISLAFVFMPYLATKLVKAYSFEHLWWVNIAILLISITGFYLMKSKMKFEGV